MYTCGKNLMKLGTLFFLMSGLVGCDSESGNYIGEQPSNNSGGTNSAPMISGVPPSGVVIGESYSFTPTASDADGDTLTFSIQNKPSWSDFSPTTGTLSGSPTLGDIRTYSEITIEVTDNLATTALASFAIDVVDVGQFSVTLSWTPPTENVDNSPLTDLAAYKFYWGLSEGNYPNSIYVANPGLSSYTVQNLVANTYYLVVSAVNQSGVESAVSNVVVWDAQ